MFVKTLTPFKYNLLIVLWILKALPGMALDENITISSGLNLICLWVPSAILDNAARGSPWEPVHSIVTSPGFRVLATSGDTNNSLWSI